MKIKDVNQINNYNQGTNVLYTEYDDFVEVIKIYKIPYVFRWTTSNIWRLAAFIDGVCHHIQLPHSFSNMEDYKKAMEKGFNNYENWQTAKNAGFHNSKEWNEAKRLGYPNHDSWKKGEKGGFEKCHEYQLAQKDGFDIKEKWQEFKKSGFTNKTDYEHAKLEGIRDQHTYNIIRAVTAVLKPLTPGFSIGLDRIVNVVNTSTPNLRYNNQQIEKTMKITQIRKLGFYEPIAGVFVRQNNNRDDTITVKSGKIKFSNAVIDGSNVCYSIKNTDGEPQLANLMSLMGNLQKLGLNTLPIVSAKLRHVIDDPEKLEELISNGVISQAPAGKDDDFFIIKAALDQNSFIISNDNFRNWKEANQQRAAEIEARRVSFTFVNGEPILDSKLDTLNSPD